MSKNQEGTQQSDGNSWSSEGTCGAECASYVSIGRIRVRAEMADDDDQSNDVIVKVFFTPTKELSVSHSKEDYAAFLCANEKCSDTKCADMKWNFGIFVPYKSNEGVPILVRRKFAGLIHAALQQSAVEIEVIKKDSQSSPKDCKKRELHLRAITIPTGGQIK